MVLSYEAGMKKVEEDETIEALWIVLDESGDFKQYSSSSFLNRH